MQTDSLHLGLGACSFAVQKVGMVMMFHELKGTNMILWLGYLTRSGVIIVVY